MNVSIFMSSVGRHYLPTFINQFYDKHLANKNLKILYCVYHLFVLLLIKIHL